jgi:fibronectin type 3 domain-containing protein/tetratricopeptide (TPR) repeat protein
MVARFFSVSLFLALITVTAIQAWGEANQEQRAQAAAPATDPISQGETLYQKGKLAEATAIVKEALSKLTDDASKVRASILMGMINLSQGQPEAAEEQFKNAVLLDPRLKLSPKKYPPNVVRLFDQVRARNLGAVIIQTLPADADVSIDGKPMGLSPVALDDLFAGQHKLKIVKSGYRTEERDITVKESERLEFYLELAILDDTPPVIEHPPVTQGTEEKSLKVKAKITDNLSVAEARLFFRVKGAPAYESATMDQVEKGVYEGTIPSGKMLRDGAQYYIQAKDPNGNEARDGTPEKPHDVKVAELDKEPPRIFHTPLGASSDASKLVIRANVNDNKSVAYVKIFYKRPQDASYLTETMKDTKGGGDYEFAMPDIFMTSKRIDYYIEAADGAGNVQYSGRADSPYTLAIYKVLPFYDGFIVERKKEGDSWTRIVTVNIGTMKGVDKDKLFTVFRASEKIVDPQTGMVLAINQKITGKIKITVPGPTSSQAKIQDEVDKNSIQAGDMIRLKPSAPTGLNGNSKKYRENSLRWSMNPEPEVQGYIVFRSDNPQGPFEEIKKVYKRDTVEIDDTGGKQKIVDGQKYFYKVVAFNDDKEKSDPSEPEAIIAKGGPNPPSKLTIVSGLIREIQLKWAKSDDADTVGYKIFRSGAEGEKFDEIADLGPEAITFTDKDKGKDRDKRALEDGRKYYYKIVSYNREKKMGNPTATETASSRAKPAAPASFQITSSGVRSVALSWTAHPDPDITGYRVYRHTQPDGLFTIAKEISGRTITEYTDQDKSGDKLKDGIVYYYRLTAVNVGGAESEFTSAISVATLGPPPPPTDVKAASGLVKQSLVTWAAPAAKEVAGFTVYRGETPQALKQIKKIRDPKASQYKDVGEWGSKMKDGTEYFYAVRSFNDVDVESEVMLAVSATTKPSPSAPTGISATSGEAGKSTIRWTANPEKDIVSYRVMRSASFDGSYAVIATVKETLYEDAGLKNGATYFYKVQAQDKDDLLSKESAPVSAITKPLPKAPSHLSAQMSTTGAALTWTASPEAEVSHYNIYSAGFFGKQKLGESKQTGFTVTALKPDTSYTFIVTVVDKTGLESEPSPPVTAQTNK